MPQAPSVARGLPFVEGTVTPRPSKRLAGESAGASTRLKRLETCVAGVSRNTKRRAAEALTRHAHAGYNPCRPM